MLRSLLLSSLALSLAACDCAGTDVAVPEPEPEVSVEPPLPGAKAGAKAVQLGDPKLAPQLQHVGKAVDRASDPRVTCRTGRAMLTRRFGPEQVEDKDIDVGEGETQPGTVVAAGTPNAQEVVWADGARTRPERIVVLGDGIRDPHGLGLGSTLAELEEALGPFQLAGFEWDYGGTVMLEGTRLEKLQGKVFFRLQPGDLATPEAQTALQAVIGDSLFASSDANVIALAPVVGEFLLVCPEIPTGPGPSVQPVSPPAE